MSKITQFDKINIDTISREMMDALQRVGARYGVKFDRKSIRYTKGDFRVTVQCEVEEKAEGVLTKEEQNYNYHGKLLKGLPELGTKFRGEDGLEYTIVGWNTRARKYPVMLVDQRGKGVKCGTGYIKANCR